MKFWPSACSEFPNDNPHLHEGTLWVCSGTRAPAEAKRVSRSRPEANVRVPLGGAAASASPSSASPGEDGAPSEGAVDDAVTSAVRAVSSPAPGAEGTMPADVERSVPARSPACAVEVFDDDEDPFVNELMSLLQSDAPASVVERVPTTEAAPTDAMTPAAEAALTDATEPADEVEVPEAAPAPVLEPLSLDGFLTGQAPMGEVEAVAPTQGLEPLQLDFDLSAASGAWDTAVACLSRYLMQRNATRAAALLPALLSGERVTLSRLPQTVQECLVADGIAEPTATGIEAGVDFRRRARRMRRSSADGRMDGETLSRWFCSVVRGLLASPESEEVLMSEWAARGVLAAIERAA